MPAVLFACMLSAQSAIIYDEREPGNETPGLSNSQNETSQPGTNVGETPNSNNSKTKSYVCDSEFVDPRDGNSYPIVQIGLRCWMAKNLSYLPVVSPVNQGSMTDPNYYVYGYQGTSVSAAKGTDNYQNYGALYNWPASLTACPEGWHTPTQSEWVALTDKFGGATQAGGKLKNTTTSPSAHPRWASPNTGATNESGFSAFPGGLRTYYGTFDYIGSYGNFWSATGDSQEYSWYRHLGYNAVHVGQHIDFKSNGFSVRCLWNESLQGFLPTIQTIEITSITSTSAVSGGNITDDGGTPVTMRGVCWSTSQNPTIDNNDGMTEDGSGIGEFPSNLSDLIPETEYFIRAYATNSEGTAYGNELSFTTQSLSFVCDPEFVDARDGNVYPIVQIGNQCWMAKNLAYLPLVSPPSEGSYVDPLYYVYGYFEYSPDEAKTFQNYQTYGVLYNRAAASTACPQGWYLPSDNDWKILEGNMDSQYGVGNPFWDNTGWRGFDVGKNLKTTIGWYIDTGTDLAGFSALPAGYRNISGDFIGLTESSVWWTSSNNYSNTAWSRYLHGYYDQSYRYWDETSFGFSVRCLLTDSQANLPTVITTDVVNITGNSARCGGNVTDDGGDAVSSRGVVWNTFGDPTVDDNYGITYNGDGVGSFTSYLTYLDPETQYFVRAYATNSAGTAYGDQLSFETTSDSDDWTLPVLTLYYTSEAEIMVRTGDIDNLGFGWPEGFNPFSGEETPVHSFPFYPDPYDPDGTDRIMVISGYNYLSGGWTDGYTITTQRPDNIPQSIYLQFNTPSITIQSVVIQMFVDDFQRGVFGNNYFQVSIDNVRIPILETVINALDQTGPIGKMITVQIPESFIYLFEDGEVSLFIDDPINNVGDGFAIDFVRLLINPGDFQNTGTIYGFVRDSYNEPIEGATVTASGIVIGLTDAIGYYELQNVPAGLVYLSAEKDGYSPESALVDLIAGTAIEQEFTLNPFFTICEALDNCELTFQTGGTMPWVGQQIISFDLEDAAQSGAIEDNGFSWIETIVEGPGTLTFYWKVSSGENFDFLSFYIDDVPVDMMSGEVDWHYKEFGIPAGYHSLTWWYTKDGSASSGMDAGWLDQVTFTPAAVPAELNLSSQMIPPAPGGCFAASQLITVFDFTVLDGGSAILVVGPLGAIRLLEGTEVQSGGYFRAWVDVSENFCNQPEAMIAVKNEAVNEEAVIKTSNNTAEFFKVYPNPTSGILKFELQFSEPGENLLLEIFNALGKKVSSKELSYASQRQLDLSELPEGLYIIRVVHGSRIGSTRILKQ